MFKLNKIMSTALLSVLFIPATIPELKEYIDAGTGSMIFQILAAGLLGGLFLIKVFWTKLKTNFVNLFSHTKENNGNQE